jgi:hypothetical protein
MADAAAHQSGLLGVRIPPSVQFRSSSDSSTDRMLGYEPGDVGSIPPLTTISQAPAPPVSPLEYRVS